MSRDSPVCFCGCPRSQGSLSSEISRSKVVGADNLLYTIVFTFRSLELQTFIIVQVHKKVDNFFLPIINQWFNGWDYFLSRCFHGKKTSQCNKNRSTNLIKMQKICISHHSKIQLLNKFIICSCRQYFGILILSLSFMKIILKQILYVKHEKKNTKCYCNNVLFFQP